MKIWFSVLKVILTVFVFYSLFALGSDHLATKAILLAIFGVLLIIEGFLLYAKDPLQRYFHMLLGLFFIVFPALNQMTWFLAAMIALLALYLIAAFRKKRIQG
ncbi:hypothetical protein LRR81_07385 [Metabacillus sp. GX 13764]|uniref:hypothetical protein n=1 Tax=Metabacillus kandeliae TaxID=2900151 RepID=UPI001E46A630|nr:hypothetical protein [Metabacillus kandeliae]MCD7034057.1 hypothetical protein [Metabacillus kandeliae]